MLQNWYRSADLKLLDNVERSLLTIKPKKNEVKCLERANKEFLELQLNFHWKRELLLKYANNLAFVHVYLMKVVEGFKVLQT